MLPAPSLGLMGSSQGKAFSELLDEDFEGWFLKQSWGAGVPLQGPAPGRDQLEW